MSSLEIKRDEAKGKVWRHIRSKWLVETPEETVRQEYLLVLVNDYGFDVDQIAEEMDLTGRGSVSARADFVIWRTAQDKADDNAPFIIAECKSDNVTIKPHDYGQGENYARICGAPFFVTHNSRETKYWRVKKDKVPGYTEESRTSPMAMPRIKTSRNCFPSFGPSRRRNSPTCYTNATTWRSSVSSGN